MTGSEDEKEMIYNIKSSKTGEEIYKIMAESEDFRRPSEILEEVQEKLDISRANFYNSLNHLNEKGVVDKIDGERRATIYQLKEEARDAYSDIYGEALNETKEKTHRQERARESEADLPPNVESGAQSLVENLADNYVMIDKESYEMFRDLVKEGEYEKAEMFAHSYTERQEESLTAEIMSDMIEDNKTIDSIRDLLE